MSLHVFKNDVTDWVVAESAADATNVLLELGTGVAVEDLDTDWQQLPDDKVLAINFDECDGGRRAQTCAAWCAEKGRGVLGSTEC